MAIVKTHKKENPFVILDKTSSNDNRLSFKAKGIHTYLIGKPDDWEIYINHLAKVSTDGKDSVITGLNELFNYGYAYKEQQRGERGRFAGWDYHIYEIPTYNPHYMKEVESFYDDIKNIKIDAGVVAKELKKEKSYISKIINKEVLPGIDEIEKILSILIPKNTNVENKPFPPKADFPKTDYPKTENPSLLNNDSILNNDSSNKNGANKKQEKRNKNEDKKVGREKSSTHDLKKIYSKESIEYKLTSHLIQYIKKNNPRQPVPEKNTKLFYNWIDEIDKLHRLGPVGGDKGYSYEEIKKIIDFCQTHDFWYSYILSAKTLREKIITLENLMNSSKKPISPKKTRFHFNNQRDKNDDYYEKIAENKREEIKSSNNDNGKYDIKEIKEKVNNLKDIYGDNFDTIIFRLKDEGVYEMARDNNLI